MNSEICRRFGKATGSIRRRSLMSSPHHLQRHEVICETNPNTSQPGGGQPLPWRQAMALDTVLSDTPSWAAIRDLLSPSRSR